MNELSRCFRIDRAAVWARVVADEGDPAAGKRFTVQAVQDPRDETVVGFPAGVEVGEVLEDVAVDDVHGRRDAGDWSDRLVP